MLAKFLKVLNKISKFWKQFFKENVNIKVEITSFKIKNYFLCKDNILNNLKLSWYLNLLLLAVVLATLGTYIEEYIKMDNKSHISEDLSYNTACSDLQNPLPFKTIDKVNS